MPLLIAWGIRKRLHRKAVKLAEALVMYEDSLCRGCGLSGFLTYDRHDLTAHVHLRSLECIGCEAKESAARVEHGDPWPGTKTYVTFDEGGDDDGQ
jgi:hypothetical protein